MSLSGQLFPVGLLWFFDLLLIPVLFWAVRAAPWSELIQNKVLQHRYLAATVILLLVWRVNIDLSFDVLIHFLGLTTITLVFGWPLAVLSAFVAQLGFLFSGLDQASSLAMNFIFSGALPVGMTWWIHRWIEGLKSENPFVFIMGTGFLSCLLTSTLVSLAAILLLLLGGRYEFQIDAGEYLAYLPLFIFPEAVINGMFISGLSILHPDWVLAFNDDHYFKAPDKDDTGADKKPEKSLDLEAHETQNAQKTEQDDPDARYRPPPKDKE